jgi:hypothetical protein
VEKAESLKPALIAFVTPPDLFVAAFRTRYPAATTGLGAQAFRIGASDVWLMGLTTSRIRGEALTAQEDLFFALGERMQPGEG